MGHKVRAIIGDGPQDDKKVTILNRNLEWDGNGFDLSADPKHRSEILEAFWLTEESRGITVAVEEVVLDRDVEEPVLLEAGETKKFRSLAARFNYLGQDRPDLQFGVKEMCQRLLTQQRTL